MTERDVVTMDRTRPRLWNALQEELREKTVVIVGTSLRDPSIVRFLDEVERKVPGYFVVPQLWKSTPARLKPWNLMCIESDANTFLSQLNATLS